MDRPFHQMIAVARAKAGFTQTKLAELIGRSPSDISHWEAGRRAPSLQSVALLEDALGITDESLMHARVDAYEERRGKGTDEKLDEVIRLVNEIIKTLSVND